MDQYFELEEITDPERVRFTTTKLKKTAGLWWAHVRQKREQEEKRYEEQKVLKFKDSFLPGDVEADLLKKFKNLRQGCFYFEMAMREYMKEFNLLSLQCRVKEGDAIFELTFSEHELHLCLLDSVEAAYRIAFRV